jgi:hypothetical protein
MNHQGPSAAYGRNQRSPTTDNTDSTDVGH